MSWAGSSIILKFLTAKIDTLSLNTLRLWVGSIILLSFLIAVSAIDLELLIIPLAICWFIAAVGVICSALGVYIIEPAAIREYALLPSASAKTASLAVGAAAGLVISLVLLEAGLIKRSYDSEEPEA